MRPIFEDGFVDGLSLAQVIPAVSGNAAPQDVMMAAFNNVDRVDLEIAKMFNRRAGRVGTVAERLSLVEALRAKPDSPRDALGKGNQRLGRRRHASAYIGRLISSTAGRARADMSMIFERLPLSFESARCSAVLIPLAARAPHRLRR